MKKQYSQPWRQGVVGGLMALTLLAGVPQSAAAQTLSLAELQAKIAQLQATIAALSGGATLGAYTWSTPLRIGSTGEAVRELQRFLNSDPDTRVAVSGVGSAGSETTYYGPATAAAVSKFQVKYRSDILAPSGLVNPTGYFGPSSIAKANALRNAAPTTPTTPTTPTNPGNNNGSGEQVLQGEGELIRADLDDADDTDIHEAAADAEVAELTLESRNGDIRINRLDLALVADSGNSEKDPWDTFDTVSIWVDGDKVAERSIDRKSDYLNRNAGTLRLSNLDIIAQEDEQLDVVIALSVKNNINGAGTTANWSLSVNGMRYFDADGVANDDRTTGDLGDSVDFSIVNRGEGEELKFVTARSNPESATIVVDDSRRTNNVTALEYTIEAVEGDIELDTLAVVIETNATSYDDVVNAARLVIDGRTYRSTQVVTTGNYAPNRALVTFDIDRRVTIDEGDNELVKVVVDLKAQTAYQNGTTIKASVTSDERDLTEAEGEDDVKEFSGTAVGNVHRLVAQGLALENDTVRFTTDSSGRDGTVGSFTITFPVTAIEGDFYVKALASTTAGTSTGGVGFAIDGDPTLESMSAVLSSTADEDTPGVFTVREGRTETFTVSITIDPTVAGQYRAGLTNIVFSNDTDGVTGGQQYSIVQLNKFRTPYQFINN